MAVGAMAASAGRASGFVNHALGVGINVAGEFMNPNISAGEALVRGAFWAGAEAVIPGFSQLTMIAGAANMLGTSLLNHHYYGESQIQGYYRPGFGGNHNDTQQAYTMRQRSATALQQTKMNARSVLGSEARTFHSNF